MAARPLSVVHVTQATEAGEADHARSRSTRCGAASPSPSPSPGRGSVRPGRSRGRRGVPRVARPAQSGPVIRRRDARSGRDPQRAGARPRPPAPRRPASPAGSRSADAWLRCSSRTAGRFSQFVVLGGAAALRWERHAARWADVIVCVSERERQLGEEVGIRGRFVVVPNAVDLSVYRTASDDERRAARASLGLPRPWSCASAA